jgi:hypothetical protein
MDDFSVASLGESKNEWCARLLNILTPSISQGVKSIFDEAWKLCLDNKEKDKYLMTFQNFLTRVPQWNPTIIDNEKTRIIEISGCTYLEELITCVHVIQLKMLTCVRVGSKQKKIDINVPSVNDFIHKIYIHVARKIYTNIYLFEKNIVPLQIQKNSREVEIIIKECILNAIRDSIPVEGILRAYMDETEEQDVEVKEVTEPLPDAPAPAPVAAAPAPAAVASAVAIADSESTAITKENLPEYKQTSDYTKLSFADDDSVMDEKGNTSFVNSPKDEKNLEELERNRVSLQSINDDDDDEESDGRLTIGENIKLDVVDVNDLNRETRVELAPPVLDFEVLV